MKNSPNPLNDQTASDHGRRDFLSLSLLAGSTLLLSTETHAFAQINQDDAAILNTVGLGDSIALYADLLEDVRRFALQKDAQLIYVAKAEATSWLDEASADAERLRSKLEAGTSLTDQDKEKFTQFLSQVSYGGKEISRGLIRMRKEPLEEIKNLDADFDKIRAELARGSNAVKSGNPEQAREAIVSAIRQLEKYSRTGSYNPNVLMGSKAIPPTPEERERERAQVGLAQEPYKPVSVPAISLRELLQTVLDLLNAAPTSRPSNQHHSLASAPNYNASSLVPPALENTITSVLRSRLNPSSWLQRAIGYAVAFPILLRVTDKNNRIKLLNDALRVVPPGLRNPLLDQLAKDLANLN